MPRFTAPCSCLFGLAIALGACGAHAQMSTSNCIAIGPNLVHCDTMDMGPTANASPQAGPNGGEELGRGLGILITRTRENNFRKRVGKLLADGDCQSAARMAFESGRLELGQSIMAACHPDSAPAASEVAQVPALPSNPPSAGPAATAASLTSPPRPTSSYAQPRPKTVKPSCIEVITDPSQDACSP